jgi:hypothetical protein
MANGGFENSFVTARTTLRKTGRIGTGKRFHRSEFKIHFQISPEL